MPSNSISHHHISRAGELCHEAMEHQCHEASPRGSSNYYAFKLHFSTIMPSINIFSTIMPSNYIFSTIVPSIYSLSHDYAFNLRSIAQLCLQIPFLTNRFLRMGQVLPIVHRPKYCLAKYYPTISGPRPICPGFADIVG